MTNPLDTLLNSYSDKITDVYEEFIYEFETKGLQWAWMLRKEFFHIPADKKILPFFVSLPLLTYTRINLSKSNDEIQEHLAELKKKYETLPEFQGRELPEVPTIRHYLDQHFMVYPDDKIEFKISYYHHTLVHQTGLIKDLKFDMDDITKAKVKMTPGEMLTVTIKLVEKGQQRLEEEYKAFINEADTYLAEKISTESVTEKIKTLPEEIQKERMKLFGYKGDEELSQVQWDVKKLPATDIVVVEEMVNAMIRPELTNEQVLAQENCMRIVNLNKMVDWLSRPYGGGTETDYR